MLPWVGAFAKRYVLPVSGAVVSCLGLIFHAIGNRVRELQICYDLMILILKPFKGLDMASHCAKFIWRL